MFTQQFILELLGIIDQYQLVFIANNLGVDVISDEDKERLKFWGVDIDQLKSDGKIEEAFMFGMLSISLRDKDIRKLSLQNIKDYFSSGEFIPLNQTERTAIDFLKTRTFTDIKNLGSKIGQDVTNIISQKQKENRVFYEKIIREEFIDGVEKRKQLSQITSEIHHRTGNWGRDFDRITDFVLHEAFDEGRAAVIERDSGLDSLVYKIVYTEACEHCISLYTTNGIGSAPKLFKLSELRSNGTNIRRKTKDWKPVIGSTHPFCRCTIHYLPENYIWDQSRQVFMPDKNWERKVQRKSSIRVSVGDKETILPPTI